MPSWSRVCRGARLRLRGEWFAGEWFGFGVVLQAKFQRVDAEFLRHFVDRAFKGCAARCLARGAHEHRRSCIDTNCLVRGGQRGRGIKSVRGAASGFEKIIEGAGCGDRVVIDGGQRPVLIGAKAQGLARYGAMADSAEHLVARQRQLYRTIDQTRGHNAEHLRPRNHTLAAETTAEERAADVDFSRFDAEQAGNTRLGHFQALAGRVDGERIAMPGGNDGVRLHRIVILRWCFVNGVQARGRGGQAGFGIAFGEG